MDQKAFQTQTKLQTIDTQLWRYPGTAKLDPDSFKELQKSSHTIFYIDITLYKWTRKRSKLK